MSKKEKIIPVDTNTTEGKEMLLNAVKTVQTLDNQIKMLQNQKTDFLKDQKANGLNTTVITKEISKLRESMKLAQDPSKQSDSDIYGDIIAESGIVCVL